MIFHHSPSPSVRPARFAGSSYPANETALSDLLDSVVFAPQFSVDGTPSVRKNAQCIIAPHIDFRVGLSAYAPAYRAILESDAELFVILATSHYGWGKLIVPTFQHFSTPRGVAKTDADTLRLLYEKMPSLSRDDSAHEEEHSIEFEVVFLQHFFGHREFSLLPLLVTSFYPLIQKYRRSGKSPLENEELARFLDALRETLALSGKRVAFVVSGDMAHVGRKFGDAESVETLIDKVEKEDRKLLSALQGGDAENYFQRIAAIDDAYRICGLPPAYTALNLLSRREQGEILAYERWLERPTGSAVTYSSLAYYDVAL
jgi:AmmeMemoRadiSam system protein B